VEGYRIEIPEMPVVFDEADAETLHVDRELVATWTQTGGLVGGVDEQELEEVRHARSQQVAYKLAAEILRRHLPGHDGAIKPWLFPALVDLAKQWLDPDARRVTFAADTPVGALLLAEPAAQAAQALFNAVVRYPEARNEILLPILRRFNGEGSTDQVSFVTRKVIIEATKSPVSHVVLDGVKGNSWEQILASLLEDNDRVASYVKNDHLGFTIPYLWKGRSHDYWPDFLVRLVDQPDDDYTRTLIVEVSGGRKDAETAKVKAITARDQWCTAVNNHGGFGRWGYVEITNMLGAERELDEAIELVYADEPITGNPDRLLASRGA
jgi:type III restriction enzyme